MSHLEEKFLTEPWSPRAYFRYVDDVFAILKRDNVSATLENLNRQHKNIEFTCEIEVNEKLPFLDLIIGRKDQRCVYEIYRKPTDSQLTIPADSHTPTSYKLAAYETMFHRLYSIPLTKDGFSKERSYIYDTARVNGYDKNVIARVELKHKNKKQLREITTLRPCEGKLDKNSRLMLIGYHPPMSEKIRKVARQHGINSVYTTRGTVGEILINLKDKRPNEMKSGVYRISCETCNREYVGQTRRRVRERFKEHDAACRLNRPHSSAVAEHVLGEKHKVGEKKLIREVANTYELNSWESFYITNTESSLNLEDEPIRSQLFKIAWDLSH